MPRTPRRGCRPRWHRRSAAGTRKAKGSPSRRRRRQTWPASGSRGQLGLGQPVGDEGSVWLHRRVVGGVEQPEEYEGHPQREHERPEEQADRAADRTDQEVRLSSAPFATPRPVAHRADERLDQEACDRPRQVQKRQLRGVGAEELVDRVYRRLLQAEAVLDAKEPEVHKQYGPEAQRRFALEILALDLGR